MCDFNSKYGLQWLAETYWHMSMACFIGYIYCMEGQIRVLLPTGPSLGTSAIDEHVSDLSVTYCYCLHVLLFVYTEEHALLDTFIMRHRLDMYHHHYLFDKSWETTIYLTITNCLKSIYRINRLNTTIICPVLNMKTRSEQEVHCSVISWWRSRRVS